MTNTNVLSNEEVTVRESKIKNTLTNFVQNSIIYADFIKEAIIIKAEEFKAKTEDKEVKSNLKDRFMNLLKGIGRVVRSAYATTTSFIKRNYKDMALALSTLSVSSFLLPGVGLALVGSTVLYASVKSLFKKSSFLVASNEALLYGSFFISSFLLSAFIIGTCPYLVNLLGANYLAILYILVA